MRRYPRPGKHMKSDLNMIYWKVGKFWLGKLKENPEIMTQGKTLKELEENIRDAYRMMVMDHLPASAVRLG